MGVRVPGRIARGELPTEPYGTHRGHPGHRLVGVDGRPIPPPAQHPRRTQDNPSSPQRWGRSSSNGSQPMINRRSSHKAQTSALGVSDKSLNTDPIPKYRRKDARGKTDMSATAKEPRKPYVPAMGHDRLLLFMTRSRDCWVWGRSTDSWSIKPASSRSRGFWRSAAALGTW